MKVSYTIGVLKIGSMQGASVVSIGYLQHDPDLDGETEDEQDEEGEMAEQDSMTEIEGKGIRN